MSARNRSKSSKKSGAVPGDHNSARHDTFDPARAATQPESILVFGPDGRILYVNPAMEQVMGYPAKAMIGRPLLAYVPEEQREIVRSGLAGRDATGSVLLPEVPFHADGGLVRSMIAKGRPVLFGNDPATLLFLIDITGRKALEDELAARAGELQKISDAYKLANRKLTLLLKKLNPRIFREWLIHLLENFLMNLIKNA